MSSMDKEIMKIFLKVLQVGSKYLGKEAQDPPKDPNKEKETIKDKDTTKETKAEKLTNK